MGLMEQSPNKRTWGGGDPLSRALLDLTAGRAFSADIKLGAGLIELAQRHGLIGILAEQTDSSLIRAIHARETARAGVLSRHLHRILERFSDAGLRVAVIKGPAVALRYRSPSHRGFSDLDLLVETSQLESALGLLSDDEAVMGLPPKRPKADKRDIVLEDASGVRFNLDLHWDLFSYKQFMGVAEGATEAAWKEAKATPDSPLGPLWEIPDSFLIPFLAAHSVLDHRFRLILFRDFVELAGPRLDWSAVESVAAVWGLRSTTYLGLWIGADAVGAGIPPEFLAALRPRSGALTYIERSLPRVDLARFDGHRPHPVNLAAVTLHDSFWRRTALMARAPAAFPGWRRRVASDRTDRPAPRVLIAVSTDRRRGAEVFTERLRDGLCARGFVAEAVSLSRANEGPRVDIEALDDRSADEMTRFDWGVARSLRARIRWFRPDLLIANGGATLRYGVVAGTGTTSRLVYIGIGEPEYWIRSRLSRWANRMMLRRAHLVLAVSDRTRDQLLELEPRLDGRVHATYTGIPETLFRLTPQPPDGPLHIIMMGSLSGEKDPMRALDAAASIEDAILRFVGDGPLASDLAIAAERLGITDRVEFAGSVTDVTNHLQWAHVLILTSRSEGLPGAILEAGAAGIPTVTVDIGGVREAVIDGLGGYVVGDQQGLIRALRRLNGDREALKQMGQNARAHVAEHFALDDVVDNYARLLMDVMP